MANPILNEDKFLSQERVLEGEPMTINGTLQVTLILGLLMVVGAAICWSKYSAGYTDIAMMMTAGGGIIGFILGLVIAFTRNKYLIPIYAACEGLLLGGLGVAVLL